MAKNCRIFLITYRNYIADQGNIHKDLETLENNKENEPILNGNYALGTELNPHLTGTLNIIK